MTAFHAKKSLGQHFLISSDIISKIADLIFADKPSQIVEIGPGLGALTDLLSTTSAKITAVEFDRDMLIRLNKKFEKSDNVTLVEKDFLQYDPSENNLSQFTLAGNIPYNITSPVIDWCVRYRSKVDKAVLMIQREMADRLAAVPGCKDWSPIAILTQLHFDIKSNFDVQPEAFDPPPKVMSSVISLTPKEMPEISDYEIFERIVRASFKQRRKLLSNNLVPALIENETAFKEILDEIGLDFKSRAEQLTTKHFLQLTESIISRKLL